MNGPEKIDIPFAIRVDNESGVVYVNIGDVDEPCLTEMVDRYLHVERGYFSGALRGLRILLPRDKSIAINFKGLLRQALQREVEFHIGTGRQPRNSRFTLADQIEKQARELARA